MKPKKSRRGWVWGLLSVVVVVVGFWLVQEAFVWYRYNSQPGPTPEEWVAATVSAVTAEADDAAWVEKNLAQLTADNWFDLHFMEFANGEWMAYRQACSKKPGEGKLRDVFLGRGSDGTWYWSTNHFCVDMLELGMDNQSPSLEAFVYMYHLNPIAEPLQTAEVYWEHPHPGPPRYDWKPKEGATSP